MNDLTINSAFAESFPSLFQGLKKAQNIFNEIKSFTDIERIFLKGTGLAENTYRSYLEAVRQFYLFTKGLNPLQVRPGDIEAFYDYLLKKVDRNTAYLRIRGLKKFFAGIRNIIPVYTSPFETMETKLVKKLNKTKNGNRTKKALSIQEIKDLLTWLKTDATIKGAQNYAIIYTLVTSGLRSAELCQLKWKNVEFFEGSYSCSFLGKGNKPAEQELYSKAVEACKLAFWEQFRRNPYPGDSLFWTVQAYPGDIPRPLTYHTLWNRTKEIGKKAKDAGIIKRDITFSPHLMRRSYATLLYKSGMGLKAIQGKTRHSNIATLTNHYIDDSEKSTPYLKKIFGQ